MAFFEDQANETLEFEFTDSKYHKAMDYVEKFNRKAVKLGFPEIILTQTGERWYEVKSEFTGEIKTRIHLNICKLSATVKLIIAGWDFIAKLEPVDIGSNINIVTRTPWYEGEIPEKYRTVPMDCEHCNIKRYRMHAFVLLNTETGEYKQVGSSCLKDFLGHDAPDTILSYFSGIHTMINVLGSDDEDLLDYFAKGGDHQLYLNSYMPYVVAVAETDGYVSSTKARESVMPKQATGQSALDQFLGIVKDEDKIKVSEDQDKMGVAIVEWTKQYFHERTEKGNANDYEWNMAILFEDSFVNMKYANWVASAYACYIKHIEEMEKAKAQFGDSEYIWSEGDKVELTGKVISVFPIDNDWGRTFITKFLVNNSVVTCFMNRELKVGIEYHFIDVEVVRHQEYKGVKETQVKITFRKKVNKEESVKELKKEIKKNK